MLLCWNRLCWVLILINIASANQVQIKDNAYQDIVIEIRDDVPEHLCHELIHNLEVSRNFSNILRNCDCLPWNVYKININKKKLNI